MDRLLDPENLKAICGLAALIYGVAALALFITASIAPDRSLRNDSRIVAPLLVAIAVALALIDLEFPRASQPLLIVLYPSVVVVLAAAGLALIVIAVRTLRHRGARIAALFAAALPLAICGLLLLIEYVLAHSRFCC